MERLEEKTVRVVFDCPKVLVDQIPSGKEREVW